MGVSGFSGIQKMLIIIMVLAIVAIPLAIHDVLLRIESEEERVGHFKVLDSSWRSELSYDRIVNATAIIMKTFLDNDVQCRSGEVAVLRQGDVLYTYLCTVDRIEINSGVESSGRPGYESARNVTAIGVVVNGTRNYTISFFSGDYARVYSRVFSFEAIVPETAKQGLVRAFEDNSDEYYLILNIPYIYFNVQYRKGIGNASLIIRIVFSINDENLTDPYVIEYYTNSNTKAFFSPLESPLLKRFIEEKTRVLAPLLDIDGGKRIKLKYYVEVFVKSSGEYSIELTIGYPGVRLVESLVD